MIAIHRVPEPPELDAARAKQLTRLRALPHTPTSDEIDGYQIVAQSLWEMQRYKCCYCEKKLEQPYNDVEHYRPKGRADRSPGSPETHGYWWLAFEWKNLLFACPNCNRSGKNDLFPLRRGSIALVAEEAPPGQERTLLLNPANPKTNPVEHIVFELQPHPLDAGRVSWTPVARNQSQRGRYTIEVCDLARPTLLQLYDDHVRELVMPQLERLHHAVQRDNNNVAEEHAHAARTLLRPAAAYAHLTYDVVRATIPDAALAPYGCAWPTPDVALR